MKKSNLILIIVMIALIIAAWGGYFSRLSSANKERDLQLKQAEEYSEKDLHQKAIECYEVVLKEKENADVRKLWMEAHEKAYCDGAIGNDEYAKALEQMCLLYPKDSSCWEKLLSLYITNGDMRAAYRSYTKCVQEGAQSDLITEYGHIIVYAYTLKGRVYADYACSVEGYYTVCDGENWGVLDATGETIYDSIYEYISPYNSDNSALFVFNENMRIINEDNIIENKIKVAFLKTGTYENGIIAICAEDDTWRYMDCNKNGYILDSYEMASNFAEGVAAVCKAGKWTLIDTEGKEVCQTVFSDIKLHRNGDYQYDGIMIAAVDGKYGFYNAKGEALGEFCAMDMDIYLGEAVAYKDDSGKWGYITKGEKMVIEPQFVGAKSFANDLAAISDGNRWGFINEQGEIVINQEFVYAGYFTSGGTCMVSTQDGLYRLLKLKFVN